MSSYNSLQAAETADAERREYDEFRAKRRRELMVKHNRERQEREAAQAEIKAKADAANKAKKAQAVQKDLEARVRARILSSPSATEADVKRLFDKTRDEIILEDGRREEQRKQLARHRALKRW